MAKTLTVDGVIQGDLFTVARQVTINGSVRGSLTSLSVQTQVNGSIGGDLRAAGAIVTVRGPVEGDVLAAALYLDIGINGQVGGDLIYAAPLTRIQGNVAGAALSARNGGAPTPQWTVLALAVPPGTGPITVVPEQDVLPPATADDIGVTLVGYVEHWLGIVAVGSVLLMLFGATTHEAATQALEHPVRSLGRGVLAVGICICAAFGVAVLALLLVAAMLGGDLGVLLSALAVTVVVAGIAIVLAAVGLIFLFAAYAIVALLVGRLLLGAGPPSRSGAAESDTVVQPGAARDALGRAAAHPFLSLAVGALIVAIFAVLPGIVGYLVDAAVLLMGMGAGWLAIRHHGGQSLPADISSTAPPPDAQLPRASGGVPYLAPGSSVEGATATVVGTGLAES
jgi:cytoskeletal protein CcmA (bactofilin family)